MDISHQLTTIFCQIDDFCIGKTIELALNGEVQALRLCIERLIPKIKRESLGMELPESLDKESASKIKYELIRAAFEGEISSDEAENLAKLIDGHTKKSSSSISTNKRSRYNDNCRF